MPQPVAFPDVEAIVIAYLTGEYAARSIAASAHSKVPNPRPALFTIVPRIGGARRNLVVDQPTLGVECWGPSNTAAFELCAVTRALIGAMEGRTIGGVMFYGFAELAGPTQLPDPDSNQARYVYTPSLTCRGTTI
jgi:hypothetical protein